MDYFVSLLRRSIVFLIRKFRKVINQYKRFESSHKNPNKDPMTSNIGLLLCGELSSDGIAGEAFGQLSETLNSFSTKCVTFLNNDFSDETKSFGFFCSRVLLENGCAAILGRLDPFRVLYLCEFQGKSEYELGKRARSAFAWTGDVIAEERLDQRNNLWNLDYDVSKINRALFSLHSDHIYWKPAVEKMIDFVSALPNDPALSDVVNFDSQNFIRSIKGRSGMLYSTLSKGVHWEFFTSQVILDEVTIKNEIRETLLLICHLGLVSHFIPTAYASLKPHQAVQEFINIRRLIT
jgi:hypothetical protein